MDALWDEYHLRMVEKGFKRLHQNEPGVEETWAEPMGPDGVQIMKPNPTEDEEPLIERRIVYARATQYMLLGGLVELVRETSGHGAGMVENFVQFLS